MTSNFRTRLFLGRRCVFALVTTPTFTIDSIQLFGPNSDAVVWIDEVFHDVVSIDRSDFNMDGAVDETDLGVWQAAMGQSVDGDADRDGDSDGADFLVWQRQFVGEDNNSVPLAVVPEPAKLAQIIGVVFALRWFARERLRLNWQTSVRRLISVIAVFSSVAVTSLF